MFDASGVYISVVNSINSHKFEKLILEAIYYFQIHVTFVKFVFFTLYWCCSGSA